MDEVMKVVPRYAPRPFKVAVLQMCCGPDPTANLAQALELIAEAAGHGVALALLPENALYLRIDDGDEAPILFPHSAEYDALSSAARAHGMWLMVGSLTEDSGDRARPYNTCVVLDSSGEARATYRKIHLFSLKTNTIDLDENRTISPGDEPVVANTEFGAFGLSICYDLRFPELYRALIAYGATTLICPAAFTRKTGALHWHHLLRSRAVENQSFVLAAAQCGHHGGTRDSYGHSLIVDPWGAILAEAGDDPGVIVADIDPEIVRDFRSRLPSLNDIRMDFPWTVSVQG
jgi:nitrilase